MIEHTPGPWAYCWAYGRRVLVFQKGEATIAAVTYDGDNEIPQAEANARLIAAAPDLLLELDNCLDLLVTCFPDSPDNSRIGVAVTKARAAIAKATGETK